MTRIKNQFAICNLHLRIKFAFAVIFSFAVWMDLDLQICICRLPVAVKFICGFALWDFGFRMKKKKEKADISADFWRKEKRLAEASRLPNLKPIHI